MVGKQLGRYKLIEEIGQGGMAVVYRGVDTTLQREVAVKILHPHLSRKESNRQRFAREARVVATLHHDNIVEIYDFSGGEQVNGAENDAFIVCEYIRGRTLADFIEKTSQIPVEVGVLMIVEICQAVAHAHAANIVHRDIKPENVMIRQDGVLKLMDFGIARVTDDSGSTMTGTLMGSPNYMSPEQVSGEELGPRSDLFSIGVLLYRLVTGVLPFDGGNPAAILRAILEADAVEADRINPHVGKDLARVVRRALSKDARDRHEGVRELADELLSTIAEAGLASPRDELRAYFAEPDGYTRKLKESLIARYARAGHKRVERRDIAGAMELWSRVLELDPENRDVRDALDRLGRGQRTRRLAALSLGVPLLFAGTAFAGLKAYEWVESLPTPTPVVIATTPPPTPTPATPTPTPTIEKQTPTPKTPTPTPTQIAMIVPSPTQSSGPAALPPGKGALDIRLFDAFNIQAEIRVDGLAYRVNGQQMSTLTAKLNGIVLDAKREPYAIGFVPSDKSCKTILGQVAIKPGVRSKEITVDGRRFTPDDPDFFFEGCQRQMVIRTKPAVEDGEVWVGGNLVGKVGAVVPITTGKHRLQVKSKGFTSNEDPLIIRPDLSTSIYEFEIELHEKK